MHEAVVGIDFGSSGTGYAYSFNNPDDIILGTFQDQGVDVKVPTEIILSKELKILAFGEKCKKYISENQLVNGELYFQRIKMSLYNNQNTIKPQNDTLNYNLVDIIGKVLEFVKLEAIRSIREHRENFNENKIKWVVTVPAIWNEKQKGIMIKASEQSGLISKNNYNTNKFNFFALEPEAASLYCSQDKAVDPNYIMPGKTYIICDLGGGTGDIVTHSKSIEGKISEKYQAIGGNYGSDEIDKEFFNQVIYKLFGFKNYNSLNLKNKEIGFPWTEESLYWEWINLQEEIKKRKKINENSKDKYFTLNCQIFQDFTNDIGIENLVNKYNSKCHHGWDVTIKNTNHWILSLPNTIFVDLINRQALKISEEISEIKKNVNNVESILYVGGYCSNETLINFIKKKFKNIAHLKPSHPEIAVVKGAVLFGINPNIIQIRKAKYSIGFCTNYLWDEIKHGLVGEKIFDEEENVYRCKNCFDSFIKIGQNISVNDEIIHYFKMQGPRYCKLLFYKSYKKEPILCEEEGVELIGKDEFDLGENYPIGQRNIIVKMKFGGTFVEATCIHKKSGKNVKLNLYFDKN